MVINKFHYNKSRLILTMKIGEYNKMANHLPKEDLIVDISY